MKQFFIELVDNFSYISWPIYLTLALLIVLGVALLTLSTKVKWNARMLAMGAICIALSFVLSYVRLYHMPQGGSITLCSMLPVMMFAFAYGIGPGLICALAYSFLQMFQDMYFLNVWQVLLDYTLAFSALGLTGLFSKNKASWSFPVGVIVASAVRIAMHVFSGVVFFAEYAEGSGHGPLVYSLIYNLSSVGVDGLICAVVAFIPGVQHMLKRTMLSNKAA